jgi:hypothetical protein
MSHNTRSLSLTPHPPQVVRLCAKSRETVASPVEHLTLHYIVKHLDTPDRSELRKLQQVCVCWCWCLCMYVCVCVWLCACMCFASCRICTDAHSAAPVHILLYHISCIACVVHMLHLLTFPAIAAARRTRRIVRCRRQEISQFETHRRERDPHGC